MVSLKILFEWLHFVFYFISRLDHFLAIKFSQLSNNGHALSVYKRLDRSSVASGVIMRSTVVGNFGTFGVFSRLSRFPPTYSTFPSPFDISFHSLFHLLHATQKNKIKINRIQIKSVFGLFISAC